jgi:hypothetical protein
LRIVWILLLAIAGALTGYLFTRFERTPPVIETRLEPAFAGAEFRQEVRVSDHGTGVDLLRAVLVTQKGEREVLVQNFPGSLFTGAELKVERTVEVAFEPKDLELPDGEGVLRIEARDFAWRANTSSVEIPIHVDTRPPRVAVQTGLTYVRRGGSELAVYTVSEETGKDGVRVGESFFPGYPADGDGKRRLAFYAYPWNTAPGQKPQVVATDRAGNETAVSLSVQIIERAFTADRIELSDEFMRGKVGEILGTAEGTPLDGYLKINGELRRENDAKIREICSSSSPDRLWSGAFLQMPNTHVGARFAENRSYVFEGRVVDQQTHLGYDLASNAASPVPAANDGVVAFADNLGIYGQTVILDHGMGLFSLYGHLSEIGVETGKPIGKGDPVGRSGQTGLAGGDHLHYSMMLAGVFVDPLEWFDDRWIREHLEAKLSPPPAEP